MLDYKPPPESMGEPNRLTIWDSVARGIEDTLGVKERAELAPLILAHPDREICYSAVHKAEGWLKAAENPPTTSYGPVVEEEEV